MMPSVLIRTIESHTEGMPTRIVVEGAPAVPGQTMHDRLMWANEHLHEMREFLMNEPRGHAAMFGAVLMPPTRADADYGVLYMSASGFLPMCGHGTIGLATVLVEKRLVEPREPTTEVRLDTPAGLVSASVHVQAGKVLHVTITNVPSFVVAQDVGVEIPGFGAARVDVAYGGNFYAILEVAQLHKRLSVSALRELTDLGLATIEAVRNKIVIAHPNEAEPAMLKAAILAEAEAASRPARNIMVKEPGYFDRSPCGTGTSARMALEHRRGNLGLGEPYRHESILGTVFEGRLVTETDVGGVPAVIPQITGRAWITGTCEFTLDSGDPFPAGFKF